MNKKETYIHYLNDTINQLIELAEEAKSNTKNEFDEGIVHGYYGAILRVLNQLEAFNIKEDLDLKIQEYIPEDLLSCENS